MHVHWHEGLFLQPHHLQLMQRRLHGDIRAARALFSPYCYGVLESRLSYDQLADGRIVFERLRAIMPSGQEVFYPEDANLPPLEIKAALARGAGALEILLAVPLWTGNRANAFRPGEGFDPRIKLLYIPEEARGLTDENTGENPQSVHVRKVNARLLLKDDDTSGMEFLPLLRVSRATGEDAGKARVDSDYLGPCLLLRSSPALRDLAGDLLAQLNASREQHRLKLLAGGLGPEFKWEYTMRLTVLNRFCASLPSLLEEGCASPFALYREFRELLGELLALNPADNLFDCRAYDHLDPLPAFKELDNKIRNEIRIGRGPEPLKVQFSGDAGRLRASLEDQHLNAIGYFLGIKTPLDRTRLALYVCDGNKFKMMPRTLEDAAIFGVELKEQNIPPRDLPAQGDLYYFQVNTSQHRWAQIKKDMSVSLVWNNNEMNLSQATFTLYMPVAS